MQKIVINKISSEKGKYIVYLGNGTATTFTNKEKAQQFVNQTNQFLTQQLYNINECYKLVFDFYRENWGFLETQTKANSNYSESRRFCDASINEIKNLIDLAVNRCSWTNGNYFTFLHLTGAVRTMKAILKELQPLCQRKSATAQLYKVDFYFSVLVKLESDLNNYAFLGATQFKVPVHDLDYLEEYKPQLKTQKLKLA